jgi:hypothetical protein
LQNAWQNHGSHGETTCANRGKALLIKRTSNLLQIVATIPLGFFTLDTPNPQTPKANPLRQGVSMRPISRGDAHRLRAAYAAAADTS